MVQHAVDSGHYDHTSHGSRLKKAMLKVNHMQVVKHTADKKKMGKTKKMLLGFIPMAIFVVIFAGILSALELPVEEEAAIQSVKKMAELDKFFITVNNTVDATECGASCPNKNVTTVANLRKFVADNEDLIREWANGDYAASDLRALNWNIPGAVFHVMTIVSTIGYGNFCAVTDGAKLTIVFLGLIGIGYFGSLLTLVSERIRYFIKYMGKKFNSKKKYYHMNSSQLMKAMIGFTFAYLLILSAAGPIMMDWRFGDALYFAIITFTTIGFGDFAPYFDPERPSWYQSVGYLMFAIFTTIGLSIVSGVLGAISEAFETDIKIAGIIGGRKNAEKFKKDTDEAKEEEMDDMLAELHYKSQHATDNSKVAPIDGSAANWGKETNNAEDPQKKKKKKKKKKKTETDPAAGDAVLPGTVPAEPSEPTPPASDPQPPAAAE
jgi:hypothetical protein